MSEWFYVLERGAGTMTYQLFSRWEVNHLTMSRILFGALLEMGLFFLAVDLMRLSRLATQRALLSRASGEETSTCGLPQGEGVPRAIRVTTMKGE